MEIDWLDNSMVSGRMMFFVETYVDGFGLALFHCSTDDAAGSGIIGDEGCRGLGVAKVNQAVSDGDGFTCIHVKAADLSFSG